MTSGNVKIRIVLFLKIPFPVKKTSRFFYC